jgi:hypothetical protein
MGFDDVREIRTSPDFIYFRTYDNGWSVLSLFNGWSICTLENTPVKSKLSDFSQHVVVDPEIKDGRQRCIGVDFWGSGKQTALDMAEPLQKEKFELLTKNEVDQHIALHSWNIILRNDKLFWIVHKHGDCWLKMKELADWDSEIEETALQLGKPFEKVNRLTMILSWDLTFIILHDKIQYLKVDLNSKRVTDISHTLKPGSFIW